MAEVGGMTHLVEGSHGGGVGGMTHLVEGSHGGGSGRNDVVYEEEESVLWSQADPFPDEKVELAHCQVYTERT